MAGFRELACGSSAASARRMELATLHHSTTPHTSKLCFKKGGVELLSASTIWWCAKNFEQSKTDDFDIPPLSNSLKQALLGRRHTVAAAARALRPPCMPLPG